MAPLVAGAAQAQIRSRIDDTHRVTLAGNTRPEAIAGNDIGQVDDSMPLQHMQLLLKRPEALQRQLDDFTESLADKSSPNYHHWLSADEFGTRFGVAQADIDAVTGWLTLHGLKVNAVYTNRMVIDFSGTAGQVREAFSTEIHHYEVRGARHIANDRDPQIPAALAPAVTGIASLHNFRPRSMSKPRPKYTYNDGTYDWWAVTPADLGVIYNLSPLYAEGLTGKGQTIVVIEDTDVYSTADWTTFRKTFGLSGYTSGSFVQVHPAPKSGINNCSDPMVNADGDDGEAILDAEYASASAPGAKIELASCDNTETTWGGQIALQNLLNAATKTSPAPAVVSISYGDCEADNGAADNLAFRNMFEQAVIQGVSVFVSSGDEGAASCDANQSTATHGIAVSAFASTPYNVAVGGTDFADSYLNDTSTYWNTKNSATYESAKSYIPETPWNDSCASTLLAQNETGSPITYGPKGFCNDPNVGEDFLSVVGGSGGPSTCATGTPSTTDVTSGTCKGYAKPYWQVLYGNPSDGVRDIPDVSLFAANGLWGHYYPFCWSDVNNGGASCSGAPDTWAGAGGTSFSSPIMAGIQALINQKTAERWGNPNIVYYKIARTEYLSHGNGACLSSDGNAINHACVFRDVTLGDIDVNCTAASTSPKLVEHDCYLDGATNGVLSTSTTKYAPSYKAGVGWDFATGIGTVNAYSLVHNTNW